MHPDTKWARFHRAISKIPLIGHLFECAWKDFWDSFIEYSNSLLWSTMPFWLGAIILFVQEQNGVKTFLDTFTGTFRNGELLVFTIGTVTPITYMTWFEDPKRRFPHRLALGTVAVILIVLCASFFALQKGKVPTKSDYIYLTSLGFACVAIFLRYIAIVYNKTKYPHTTEQDLIQPAADFASEFDIATEPTVQATPARPLEPNFEDAFVQATRGNASH
ncbi:hypothetical protein VSR69_43650 [Paraburkholderia phytofirmans]